MTITQTPNAHISPANQGPFSSFTQLCAESGLLTRPDGLEDGDLCDGLSDPSTLLRFLTARQFDPDGAKKQFQEASLFRQEKHINKLFDIIEISEYEQTRQLYPHWSGCRDKKGLPILMFDFAQLDKDALARWEKTRKNAGWVNSQSGGSKKPNMLQLASVFHDSLVRFVLPLCSVMTDRPNPSVPITSSTYLLDASALGLKQGWSVRFYAQELSWLLSTCYPETVERIFVCNAPSYFATIWKYLKSWVEPKTAEKIVVLMNAEVLPTLREYIDDTNIPVVFGGGYSFKHGAVPCLEDGILQQLNWNLSNGSLPPGPLKWVEDSDGKVTALAVGSEDGSKRSKRIASIDRAQK
ncbi:hypothetical protein N7495_003818 [Penicillium taxi]|uniref:uncharacterized protein n=1 Tax=Penicillium taxi TaxID=168475 RepID=UPI002545AE48|nr:uncharacterized protein N7495_003818 [Penicillium taxi]KAJ5899074.1 hypothetical protein N7495_003818 [Penicillium taxi]